MKVALSTEFRNSQNLIVQIIFYCFNLSVQIWKFKFPKFLKKKRISFDYKNILVVYFKNKIFPYMFDIIVNTKWKYSISMLWKSNMFFFQIQSWEFVLYCFFFFESLHYCRKLKIIFVVLFNHGYFRITYTKDTFIKIYILKLKFRI